MTRTIIVVTLLTAALPFDASAEKASLRKSAKALFTAMIEGGRTDIDKHLVSYAELSQLVKRQVAQRRYQEKMAYFYRWSRKWQQARGRNSLTLGEVTIDDVMIMPAGGKRAVDIIAATVTPELVVNGKKRRTQPFFFYRVGQRWKASVK